MIIRTARLIALAAAAVISMPAGANNDCRGSQCTQTTGTPGSSNSNNSSSHSGATAGAQAGAAARASGGNAAGGGGGRASVGNVGSSSTAGGAEVNVDAPAQSSLVDQSSSSSRAWSLFLPPPVFTPPMAPVQCPSATITQDATSVVMGVYSNANAKTDTSDCTLIQLRNAKVEACQYASAKQIEDLLVAKHLPGFKATNVVMTDYTDQECSVLKSSVEKVATAPAEPVQNLLQPPLPSCEQPPAKADARVGAAKAANKGKARKSNGCGKA